MLFFKDFKFIEKSPIISQSNRPHPRTKRSSVNTQRWAETGWDSFSVSFIHADIKSVKTKKSFACENTCTAYSRTYDSGLCHLTTNSNNILSIHYDTNNKLSHKTSFPYKVIQLCMSKSNPAWLSSVYESFPGSGFPSVHITLYIFSNIWLLDIKLVVS